MGVPWTKNSYIYSFCQHLAEENQAPPLQLYLQYAQYVIEFADCFIKFWQTNFCLRKHSSFQVNLQQNTESSHYTEKNYKLK